MDDDGSGGGPDSGPTDVVHVDVQHLPPDVPRVDVAADHAGDVSGDQVGHDAIDVASDASSSSDGTSHGDGAASDATTATDGNSANDVVANGDATDAGSGLDAAGADVTPDAADATSETSPDGPPASCVMATDCPGTDTFCSPADVRCRSVRREPSLGRDRYTNANARRLPADAV